jgi:hypothetical protein
MDRTFRLWLAAFFSLTLPSVFSLLIAQETERSYLQAGQLLQRG